ncbi:unnamed protein product, partial [Closterium sp. Yama58-4]
GDTCDSLSALFSTQIQSLNPGLSCSDGPRPGQLLCVDFNHTWLELGKTHLECDHYVQITPAATATTSTTTPGLRPPKSKSQGGKGSQGAPMTEPIPQPPPPPLPLANYSSQGALVTVLRGPQSCQQLWRAFGIASPTRFFQMNPGLSCDALLPYNPCRAT